MATMKFIVANTPKEVIPPSEKFDRLTFSGPDDYDRFEVTYAGAEDTPEAPIRMTLSEAVALRDWLTVAIDYAGKPKDA